VGTFLFAFVWSFNSLDTTYAGFSIGVALMLTVYNVGHISGGHVNPSVTMALLWAGQIEAMLAVEYIFAQVIGACLASWIAHGCLGSVAAYPRPGSYMVTSDLTIKGLAASATGVADWTTDTESSSWQLTCKADNTCGDNSAYASTIKALYCNFGQATGDHAGDDDYGICTMCPQMFSLNCSGTDLSATALASCNSICNGRDNLSPGPLSVATPYGEGTAFIVDFLYNTLLIMVVLHTAVAKKPQPNQYYALAIGFTVVAGAIAGGPISGGAFNPAIASMGLLSQYFNGFYIYWFSGLAASVVGVMLFKLTTTSVEKMEGIPDLVKTCTNEFIGTFYLCLSITLAVGVKAADATLAIGSTLMVVVFMGGYISGGHYNPAVTLGVGIATGKHLESADGSPFGHVLYVVCQICGALLAAAVGWGVLGASAGYPAPGIDGTGDVYPNFACVVAEMVGTMALVFGVLNSAVAQDVQSNDYYGLVIGFTVFAFASTVGGESGGAFNPAVGIGLTAALGDDRGAADSTDASTYSWIYVVGPLLGSLLACGVFKILGVPVDDEDPKMMSPITGQAPLHDYGTVENPDSAIQMSPPDEQ
jgi:aquaporin Z